MPRGGSSTGSRDPRVDLLVEKAPPFARAILTHLREVIHEAEPEVVEAVKWRRPFFSLNDKPLAMIAAFTGHCSFMFWGDEMRAHVAADGLGEDGEGVFRRITSVSDLPSRKKLLAYVRKAAELARAGQGGAPRKKSRPTLAVPADLAAALARSKKASQVFEAFPPSHRREYIQWVSEAKRDETRKKRIREAVATIAQGKDRNWRYRK